MAIRSPIELIDEVASEVADNPTTFGRGMLTVIKGGLEYGAESYAVDEGGAAALTVAVAAADLGAIVVIVVVVIVLAIAILGTIIHHFFRSALSSIPFAGGRIAGLSDVAFGWSDNLLSWCGAQMQYASGQVFAGFVGMVQWAIQQTHGAAGTVTGALIYEQVHPVKAEVDHLWVWVNDINRWVTDLSHHVSGAVGEASAYPSTIAGQLHQAQQDIAGLTHYAHSVNDRLVGLETTVGEIAAAVTGIQTHTGAVRAVNVGWQDIEGQLSTLTQETKHLTATVLPELDTLGRSVEALAPLAVLLAAGALGLQNLRKLEDDICQCPQLAGVGGVWSAIMAAKHELKGD